MLQKRLPVILIAVLLVALLISGCTSTTPAPATTSKPAATTPAAAPTSTAPASKPATATTTTPAAATSSLADFYKGKKLTIIIPAAPGGGTDTIVRAYGTALTTKLGVTVVPQNINEAFIAYRTVFQLTKPDGLTICLGNTGTLWSAASLGLEGVAWEPDKFEFLGAQQGEYHELGVKVDGPYTTVEALQKGKGLIVTGSAAGSWRGIACTLAAEILNLDAKVAVFPGASQSLLSLMQGETHASAFPTETAMQYASRNQTKLLFNVSEIRDPAIPDVPAISEFKKLTDHDKKLLDMFYANRKIWFAPPGTPKDIVDFLAKTLNEIGTDKAFIENMKKTYPSWAAPVTRDEINKEFAGIWKFKSDYKQEYGTLWEKYKASSK